MNNIDQDTNEAVYLNKDKLSSARIRKCDILGLIRICAQYGQPYCSPYIFVCDAKSDANSVRNIFNMFHSVEWKYEKNDPMVLYSVVVYNTGRRKVGLEVKLEEWKKMKGNHRRRRYLRDQNLRFSSLCFGHTWFLLH